VVAGTAAIFEKSLNPATWQQIWAQKVLVLQVELRYDHSMAKASYKTGKRAARVLGAKTFAAISAVEGLRLKGESKKRLATLRASDLSPAERRAEVVRAYAAIKGRR
jgi:hypothetical protein